MVEGLFFIILLIRYLEIGGIAFSIAQPEKRIWPPPKKQSWQFYTTWFLFYSGVVVTVILALMTWNTWIFSGEIRFFFGVPLMLLGGAFVSWSIVTLGIENTHGTKDGFIENGPYQFTRNPQYLGDIVLFIGLSLFINSIYAAVPLLLHALLFLITPFIEEQWLKKQYGEEYIEYRNKTSRFL